MEEAEQLLERLEPVADDAIRVAAILWTWLDSRRMTLGKLRRKPPEIRADGLTLPPFERIGTHERARLLEAPIPAAAELLVRIDKRLTGDPPEGIHEAKGADGEDVIVMWKRAPLMQALRADVAPPSADEQPSLSTLAPRLVVCPRECRQVTLAEIHPDDKSWRAVCAALEKACANATLSVHLDCLGDAGLESSTDGIPGWTTDSSLAVGWFDEDNLDPVAESDCKDAAVRAVRDAAEPGAVLVLPELAATQDVEEAIVRTLRELHQQHRAPALTVIGLYHRFPAAPEPIAAAERALLGDAELSGRVNEAIVLGPDGCELWRHRKLSAAQAQSAAGAEPPPGMPAPTEDITLGDTLRFASSPIGRLAVLICIDAFAEHLWQRLVQCGVDVLLVPSLSPTVHRHANALQLLVQKLWGAAFVCNRAPERAVGDASRWDEPYNRSFWAFARHPLDKQQIGDGITSVVFRLSDVHTARPGVQV
ncbi:MAG: hypothetical protein ACLQBY_06175 [Solirubrobacteraceae bacterium]